ncbi:hypothetical protein BC936DRAFT_148680 [Jimgerdemannia flammicorona]|uniref:DUF962 domain protein n=1 Tax=Jimgerdemannia flammicorona TaxID=994334 RepID=A0A433D2I4_9FUNG|nr:hypothetical protein BC936DRAFT_148680 [Jimgerdemannia flammicorona]
MSVFGDLFNLKHQLVVYGSHHNNRVNILIHIACVPLILWTALVFATNTGPLFDPAFLGPNFAWLKAFGPDGGFLAAVFYLSYYLLLAPDAAILYAPFIIYMSYSATQFHLSNPHANEIAIALHVFSWIMQFIGHGVAEKRSPKLFDNLIQAILLAPFFVFFEVLFALGYRPQLKKEMQQGVDADIKAFKAKKAIQRAKAN